MLTKEVVPELESYIDAIDRRLHRSLDQFDDAMG